MNRPIYACDRCGRWFTTEERFAHPDLPFEPTAVHLPDVDYCAQCFAEYRALPDRKISTLHEWHSTGKGAEVKPRSVR